jgi:integrase/recombinase XerD
VVSAFVLGEREVPILTKRAICPKKPSRDPCKKVQDALETLVPKGIDMMSAFNLAKATVPAVRLIDVGGQPEATPESAKVIAITSVQAPAVRESRVRMIEQFLQARSLSENTQRNYRRQLEAFCDWVGKDWNAMSMSDVTAYKGHLEERSLKVSSIAASVTAIKSFFTWMKKVGAIAQSPADGVSIPTIPEGEAKHLEQHQIDALFEALKGRGNTEARDTAIVFLWFKSGLRPEEVSLLNVGDYNGVEVVIRQGKHQSSGRVPVDEQTHLVLVEYLSQRWMETQGELKEDDPIFVSYSHRNYGDRLGYEGIYKMFKQVAQVAGLPDIHPHRGRHTFISGLVSGKVDAYLGMALTRQKSVKAYKVYSEAVRYEAARAAFFASRGIQERKPVSLEQMLERGY